MSTYHTTVPLEKTNLPTVEALRRWRPGKLIKNCLRCGRYFLRTGRAFTVRCAEGRTVKFSICRACAVVTAFAAAISSPEVQAA
jgi:hypothetical protein